MLVEINLLPRKEQKNIAFLVLVGIVLAVFFIGGIYVYWQGKSYETNLSMQKKQIQEIRKEAAAQRERLDQYEASNSYSLLEEAVQWAEDYPIKSIEVLRHLTSLLPERGFIQRYIYDETGKIKLYVQFDTSREAAYYLQSILESTWIEEASLLTLSATAAEEEQQGQDTDGSLLQKGTYLPRYSAEYEITLNRNAVKAEEGKTDSSDSGSAAEEKRGEGS